MKIIKILKFKKTFFRFAIKGPREAFKTANIFFVEKDNLAEIRQKETLYSRSLSKYELLHNMTTLPNDFHLLNQFPVFSLQNAISETEINIH